MVTFPKVTGFCYFLPGQKVEEVKEKKDSKLGKRFFLIIFPYIVIGWGGVSSTFFLKKVTKKKKKNMIVRKIEVKSIGSKNEDYKYWLNLPVNERFNAVEEIRKEYHGEDYESKCGFQRFYKVVKQK